MTKKPASSDQARENLEAPDTQGVVPVVREDIPVDTLSLADEIATPANKDANVLRGRDDERP
jgi:hypothetical protein